MHFFLFLSLNMMNRVEHKTVKLKVLDYINNYRDAGRIIEYCKDCTNYNKVWACPPYNFDTLNIIKDFEYVHIIGSQVFICEDTRYKPTNAKEQKDISYQIMEQARKDIDWRLLELEKQYTGSLCFFAGSCFLCPKELCTRLSNNQCIYPNKMRSSLEAYGFDISKTTSELLNIELEWSKDLVLPKYFILVSALFT